jgi:hypothetical protein
MRKEEKNSRLSVDLAAIQDDVTIVQRGVSFPLAWPPAGGQEMDAQATRERTSSATPVRAALSRAKGAVRATAAGRYSRAVLSTIKSINHEAQG